MGGLLPIVHVLGLMAMLMSATQLMPIVASVIYDDGTTYLFAFSMVLNFAIGFFVWLATRRYKRELKPRDGFLLVSLAWSGGAAFATVPLMLALPGTSFTDAYFETMSGLSTTGATVFSGLDDFPEAVNLWRHELNWLGGMGIIVLAVAILPLLGVGGMQVYKAETPGPMKDSKLTPRITETAKNLWLVYAGLTLLCMLALKWAGMSWLDAICHAFAALSLGGLSTHDASVGFFDSPLIEFILIVFMVIAALNFATHFLALRGHSLRPYLHDTEAKAVLLVLAVSCVGIALYIHLEGVYDDYGDALRYVSFNLVSIATDCGFVSTDYEKWPIFAPMFMLFLSAITASSGSTGGGVKMIRTLILGRQAQREMLMLLHPQAMRPLKIGGGIIPDKAIYSVLGFIFVYFMSVVVLSFALMASGLDFISAFTAIIACINNAGPGLGKVGPSANYGGLTDFETWICTLAMFGGRIELFTLLILFTPAFWRK
ncbi:MAG: potassium transporter TrkG [Burkholderiales bacterium]